MHLADFDRTRLYVRLLDPMAPRLQARFDELIERRASGEPIAYITGTREFMGLDFVVDRRVLIPRPETEGLVERTLAWMEKRRDKLRIVDVGTGSGAIALSLERLHHSSPCPQIIASDVSKDALDVARTNRRLLGACRVQLVCGSLLDWTRATFDVIIANLPYLREDQRHTGIALEPDSALYAPELGFARYAELLRQSSFALAPGGLMLCEIDPAQRGVALVQARDAHPHASVRVERDLAGLDRYLVVEREAA